MESGRTHHRVAQDQSRGLEHRAPNQTRFPFGGRISDFFWVHHPAFLMVRLQKFLAEAGVASRRVGEQMILAGQVRVNGRTVQELGTKVDPLHDKVDVDGKAIKAKRKLYVALNKPRGLICSRKDELERATIYELLPREWGHLHMVGRLDFNSEGLLFLTNDGEFSLRLTHPRYGVRKRYIATVEGRIEPAMLG